MKENSLESDEIFLQEPKQTLTRIKVLDLFNKIKELNDTIDALSEHNKDLQQQNHELTVSYYVMIGVFIITAVMAIAFYNQKVQY